MDNNQYQYYLTEKRALIQKTDILRAGIAEAMRLCEQNRQMMRACCTNGEFGGVDTFEKESREYQNEAESKKGELCQVLARIGDIEKELKAARARKTWSRTAAHIAKMQTNVGAPTLDIPDVIFGSGDIASDVQIGIFFDTLMPRWNDIKARMEATEERMREYARDLEKENPQKYQEARRRYKSENPL